MGRQFPVVASARGAPMGRCVYGQAMDGQRIRLFKVRLDTGGYDDGGAYWGLGRQLYCAESDDGEYRRFVRADSRADAAEILDVTGLLIRPVHEP